MGHCTKNSGCRKNFQYLEFFTRSVCLLSTLMPSRTFKYRTSLASNSKKSRISTEFLSKKPQYHEIFKIRWYLMYMLYKLITIILKRHVSGDVVLGIALFAHCGWFSIAMRIAASSFSFYSCGYMTNAIKSNIFEVHSRLWSTTLLPTNKLRPASL